MEVFKKSLSNIGLTRVYWCLKRCTRTGVPVRVQLYVIREVLFGAFHDIGQSPVLRLGQRTGLCQTNAVANTGAILFVMGFDAFGPTHDFAVQSVLFEVFDFDDNGLIHFVGDDYPAQGFTVVTLWSGCGVNRLSHCDSSSAYLRLFFLSLVSSWLASISSRIPSSRSRSTVIIRAISRLTTLMRPVFSIWPVAAWKRRLNNSAFALSSSSRRRALSKPSKASVVSSAEPS